MLAGLYFRRFKVHLPRLTLLLIVSVCSTALYAQFDNSGPGPAMDFVRMFLDQGTRAANQTQKNRAEALDLVNSGAVSKLDLNAPPGAIDQYNSAVSLLKEQKAKEATAAAKKALATYPKFVAAHMLLGLISFDQEQFPQAKAEFEAAAKLDTKYPRALLNLGILSVSLKDFANAESYLQKAAALRPKDSNILSALAYAQFSDQHYREAIATADRVHGLDHKNFATVHYTAADAAAALRDYGVMERELRRFVVEDPTNAMAPVARQHLDILQRRKDDPAMAAKLSSSGIKPGGSESVHTIPNSDRLKAQLAALEPEESDTCDHCSSTPIPQDDQVGVSDPNGLANMAAGGGFTIRKSVDQVALYFAASRHGQMVNDLSLSDIHLLDDGKVPDTMVVFSPQSKLPLRLALVVDTSGSVKQRFAFEKHAAARFVQKVLVNPSDLGFVVGFGNEVKVVQDFTGNTEELGKAVENLSDGGGTRLFDAVSLACWKLGAFPDRERVARVLVVLSDGEDNSSRRSLKQVLQEAEGLGITIYSVSTKDGGGAKTDADKVLQALAERSGGEALFPGDISVLTHKLDKLRELIRSRYLVAYKPAAFIPDGRYRAIRVVAEKNGKRLQVHARKGYYARREATLASPNPNESLSAN